MKNKKSKLTISDFHKPDPIPKEAFVQTYRAISEKLIINFSDVSLLPE
jgi:hypothetical protein